MVLYSAIRKHGPEAFTVKALMYGNNQAELNRLEKLVIEAYVSVTRDSGYNLTTGGDSGGKVSAETREKLSAAMKGKSRSAEHRANLGAARKGKTHTAEARAKMSAALTGRKPSAETRAKLSAANEGKKKPPRSAEHNLNQSLSQSGKTLSVETRAKISAFHKGKPKSAEAIAKRSVARRKLTDEQMAEIANHLVLGKRGTKGSTNSHELAAKHDVSTATILRTAKLYKKEQEQKGLVQ
jgi:NUMOD3 motif